MPLDTTGAATGLSPLAATAYANLMAAYRGWGLEPSPAQKLAQRDLLNHLEAAANGTLSRQVHISTLPCGTGKSQSIIAFARTMLNDGTRKGAGMLLLINRLEDIRDVATYLAAHRHQIMVDTSDAYTNTFGGCQAADQAQLVITTQEALKRTLRKQKDAQPNLEPSFDRADRYFYCGKPRAVRAHDESFSFNRPEVLDADGVVELAKAMKRCGWDEAATLLKRWSADVDGMKDGERVGVPDFECPIYGVDFGVLEAAVKGAEDKVSLVRALAGISGDEGLVKTSGFQSAIVTYTRELPVSFCPVVVTDASAKVSDRYRQMAKAAPTLIHWLTEADKSYANLTVRLVQSPASRSTYRSKDGFAGRDLLDVAAAYITSVPADKRVLVTGYKGAFWVKGVDVPGLPRGQAPTLRDCLFARLAPADHHRVDWLDYGSHTSTNAYKAVEHVALLGLNFISDAVNFAATGAAQGADLLRPDPLKASDVRAMTDGRLMDDTLQAILRGNARNPSGDGDCGKCEAVVIQSKQKGLKPDQWRKMFPGVNLIEDRKLKPEEPLKGRMRELGDLVLRRLAAGETELSNPSLYEALGMERTNFGKLVAKPRWREFLDTHGLHTELIGKGITGLRLKA
jgi:hypothetical protein